MRKFIGKLELGKEVKLPIKIEGEDFGEHIGKISYIHPLKRFIIVEFKNDKYKLEKTFIYYGKGFVFL